VGGEKGTNRGDDGQTMSKIDQAKQWRSVRGWRVTGSIGERGCMK